MSSVRSSNVNRPTGSNSNDNLSFLNSGYDFPNSSDVEDYFIIHSDFGNETHRFTNEPSTMDYITNLANDTYRFLTTSNSFEPMENSFLNGTHGISNVLDGYSNDTSNITNITDFVFNSTGASIRSQPVFVTMEMRIIITAIFFLTVVIGVIGNVLVLITVIWNPKMRSNVNLLIFNLAIADLIFLIVCIPFKAVDYLLTSPSLQYKRLYWPFGDVWCRIMWYMISVSCYSSIYIIVIMSIDRYLALVFPLKSIPFRTKRNIYISLSIMWAAVFVGSMPNIFIHGEIRSSGYPRCFFFKDRFNYPAFKVGFALTSFVIPMALIIILYMLILKKMWCDASVPSAECHGEKREEKKKKSTQLMVAVVVAFGLCWAPVQITLLLKGLNAFKDSSTTMYIHIGATVLAYVNSCLNPILYAFLSENFRKEFKNIIKCRKSK